MQLSCLSTLTRKNRQAMKNRKLRLSAITDIITNNAVASQDEILRLLASRGFLITQATLSRDLKLLRTNKVPNDFGGYSYVIAPRQGGDQEIKPLQSSLHPAALSIAISGNILIIKTRNGYASGIAYDLDMLGSSVILGTIPGADTVLAVLAENVSHEDVLTMLDGFLPPEVIDSARQSA